MSVFASMEYFDNWVVGDMRKEKNFNHIGDRSAVRKPAKTLGPINVHSEVDGVRRLRYIIASIAYCIFRM